MIEHLYATPVYSCMVVDYQTINYHIDKVIDKVNFHSIDKWGKTHLISTNFIKTVNIIKELGLKKLQKEVKINGLTIVPINLFINEKDKKEFKYLINGKEYIIPNIGVQIKLWDFDFACIPGIIENQKVDAKWTNKINVPKGIERR